MEHFYGFYFRQEAWELKNEKQRIIGLQETVSILILIYMNERLPATKRTTLCNCIRKLTNYYKYWVEMRWATKKRSWCQLGLMDLEHLDTKRSYPKVFVNITVLYKNNQFQEKEQQNTTRTQIKGGEKKQKAFILALSIDDIMFSSTAVEDIMRWYLSTHLSFTIHQYHLASSKSFQVPNHSPNNKIPPISYPPTRHKDKLLFMTTTHTKDLNKGI